MEKKTLYNLIEQSAQLKCIINKAATIQKIEKLIQAELEILIASIGFAGVEAQTFIKAIKVASYKLGHLCLIIENAAFATHLRFLIPELSERLKTKTNLLGLKSIKYKINPNQLSINKTVSAKPPNISPENSKLLKELLKSLK